MKTQNANVYDNVLAALKELDKEPLEFDGIRMKPSPLYIGIDGGTKNAVQCADKLLPHIIM